MTYYQAIEQIQVLTIPIQLSLKDWVFLAKMLLPFSAPEPLDDFIQKGWRAALIQIIIKISKRQEKHWQNEERKYTISLTPTEKYALEELLYNDDPSDLYLRTIFYEIKVQLEHFDHHKKRIPSGN
ncbi:hypothetical protein [Aureispira sp. CCB-E]|uniref:hypothetical protein n=1 Tax=Aureispira sp. CCB-E TaxID=3051121 RepID=UPI002868AE94|nr:hypothetical protein [Aureispira sp. CCB-E]WMX16307.1 hypothetical protein QP953_08010 [Aureispira sp. CCB-E]